MKKTGAEILWECLVREGVEVVFGLPGGAIMPVYDAMLYYPIHHVLVRHEQGAVHAADGYARASGKVGVCLVTSGPGATNTVSGIASAYMDSVPMVVLTGQVNTNLIGRWIEEHRQDSFDHSMRLFTVLMLELWARHYLGPPEALPEVSDEQRMRSSVT